MKLKQWLYGLAALSTLAACSENDLSNPANNPAEEGGDGYIGINIQLPTVRPTRANDTFGDGEESEYVINDAILLLFQGANAKDATCTGAFTLKNSNPVGDPTIGQVTTHTTRVANVKGINNAADSKIYALVMINGNGKGIYSNNNPQREWMIGKTIKEFQEHAITDSLYLQKTRGVGYASGIFMTNSPLSEVKGGTNNPGIISEALPVLVELNKAVWPTESQALKNPAGVIHVERAVGKVTCSKFNTDKDNAEFFTVEVGDYTYRLIPKDVSWDMAQDLADTYIVRNTNRTPVKATQGTENLWAWNYASGVAGVVSEKYRMLGHSELTVGEGTEAKEYFRPYFCQVPGYNDPIMTGETASSIRENKTFNKQYMYADKAVAWSAASAFYPRENTFPVKFMKYANTTRIGFWVNFEFTCDDKNAPAIGSDVNFYINGADKSTLYLDDKFGQDPLTNNAVTELSKRPAVVEAVNKVLDKSKEGSFEMANLSELLNFSYTDTDDGRIIISGISFKTLSQIEASNENYHEVFTAAPSYDFSNLIEGFNNYGQFYKYTGGKVFYEVRIKHFGDDLTPWALENQTTQPATTIEESYGTSNINSNYLGRYGIVRNNWYDLQVNDIKKLGYPQDPAIWDDSWPGKPDDNRDQYIAVILRVLSWAKRTQNVVF